LDNKQQFRLLDNTSKKLRVELFFIIVSIWIP